MNADQSQGSESSKPIPSNSNTVPVPSSWGPFRWNLAGLIGAVGTVLEVIVWRIFDPDRTTQVIMSMPVVSASALGLVLWWLLSGGLNRGRIGRRLAVLLGLLLLFRVSVRFDGFEGDMMPRFSWRWTPSAEEKLAEFLKRSAPLSSRVAESKAESKSEATDEPEKVNAPAKLDISDTDWPGFRGALRNSTVFDPDAKFDWSAAPQELWRHPIGTGWSSFAVVGRFAFTQEQRGEEEVVVCYEVESGQQVWVHSDAVKFEEALGGPGPRATPSVHDSKVYSLGATGVLNCLDSLTGEVVWQHDILKDADAKNISWAMSASPLIVDDMVIVNPGGEKNLGVIAYHRLTGERIWSGGKDRASYTAPTVATLNGLRQVLIFDAVGLAGHSLSDGKQLWKLNWTNGPEVNATEPAVINEDTLLIGTGYEKGGGLVKVARKDNEWSVSTAWTAKHFRLKFNAPIVRDGYAYGLDERVMVCLDLADGKVKWRNGRYGYGQIVRIHDEILVQAESGEVAVVKAIPDRYEELIKFPALTGKTWNHPVVCRDLLLVRNGEEVACFRLKRLSSTQRADAAARLSEDDLNRR